MKKDNLLVLILFYLFKYFGFQFVLIKYQHKIFDLKPRCKRMKDKFYGHHLIFLTSIVNRPHTVAKSEVDDVVWIAELMKKIGVVILKKFANHGMKLNIRFCFLLIKKSLVFSCFNFLMVVWISHFLYVVYMCFDCICFLYGFRLYWNGFRLRYCNVLF